MMMRQQVLKLQKNKTSDGKSRIFQVADNQHSKGRAKMIEIKNEWFGKKVRIIDIDGKAFIGVVDGITGAADNDETGRDSLDLDDGKNIIFFSDDEIESIEIIEE